MAETWTRLLSSIVDSSISRENHPTFRVWIIMLAKSDRDGYVWASLGGIADAARVTDEECQAALDKFMAPDPHSRSEDNDGRRIEKVDRGWLILNKIRFRDMRDEDEHRRREREKKRAQRAKARTERAAPTVAAPQPPPDFDGSLEETCIPLDMTSRAEKILPSLLEHMPGVTIEQLRDATREFVSYWTIGAGTGQRRRLWMKKLRESLRKAHRENKLRAPGDIEHDAHRPKAPQQVSDGAAKLIAMAKEEDAKVRAKRVRAGGAAASITDSKSVDPGSSPGRPAKVAAE